MANPKPTDVWLNEKIAFWQDAVKTNEARLAEARRELRYYRRWLLEIESQELDQVFEWPRALVE